MKLPASRKHVSRIEPIPRVTAPWTSAIGSEPAAISRPPPRPPRLRDDPRLAGIVEPRNGQLGRDPVVQHFGGVPVGTLEADRVHELPALVIVTGRHDSLIEETSDGTFLTGKPGASNNCRLIFRAAFVRVRLELLSLSGSADAHIGFLEHRNFEEVQTFSVVHPRGARTNSGGALRIVMEYRAGPLSELQGIVWRGGLLQIESVTLSP